MLVGRLAEEADPLRVAQALGAWRGAVRGAGGAEKAITALCVTYENANE